MKKTLLLILLVSAFLQGKAQSDTSFWFAAPDISSDYNYDRPIYLRISAYQLPSIVTVSQPANPGFAPITITIPAYTTQSIDLTTWIGLIECGPGNIIQNKGLKIKSDNKIAVYYEVNVGGPNPEIFVLKGKNALGTRFYISGQNLLGNSPLLTPQPFASFNIVASEDNTVVTITPTNAVVGHAANVPFVINLNKGQTYAAIATSQAAGQHLSASYVIATKPIAITLADDLLQGTSYGGPCEDLAGDQTIPFEMIGTEYIAIKTNLNAPFDKVYIIATQNGTSINQDGVNITTINAGQSTVLSVNNPSTYIQSTAPIYVYQLAGAGCEVGSAILPTINCTGSSSVSVARSSSEPLTITLLVKSGGQGNFLINEIPGVILTSQFSPVPATANQWFFAKIDLPLASYPNGSIVKVRNTSAIFQMGYLVGQTLGAGYGYFSDYNSLRVRGYTNTASVCVGNNINLFADSIPTSTYTWTGPNGFTSNLQNPVINNATLLNAGRYVVTMNNPACGISTDTIPIMVRPNATSTVNQIICDGQSYLGHTTSGTYVDVFPSANGCDSTRTLNLTVKPRSFTTINQAICEGQSYEGHTTSGTYVTILIAANGCDSVKTLNLTVKPKSFFTLNLALCQGQTYNGHGTTGTYVDTFVAANGCDSVRTLNLTIKPKSFSTINQTICEGQTFEGYALSGTYVNTFIAANGCDSTRTLNLVVKPKVYNSITQTICKGQSYLGYNATGTYSDIFLAANGCDSIRTLQLTVLPAIVNSMNKNICKGQSFLGYNQTGVYNDTLVSVNGCDSIRTLNLIIEDTLNPDLGLEKMLCFGDSLKLSPGIFSNYLWQNGSVNNFFFAKQQGLYSVIVSNSCGSFRDEVYVKMEECNIFFPNVFTPNNDNKNDVFRILNAYNLNGFRLIIYNRWGQKVFESVDYTKGWDGKFKGITAEPGTYIWYCEYSKLNKANTMKGSVILLR